MGPGLPSRPANVAMLPVTCPGCDACPDLAHQHMVLVSVRDIETDAEVPPAATPPSKHACAAPAPLTHSLSPLATPNPE